MDIAHLVSVAALSLDNYSLAYDTIIRLLPTIKGGMAAQNVSKTNLASYVVRGRKKISRGHYVDALDILLIARNIYPDDTEIAYLTGLAAMRCGSYSMASDIIKQLLGIVYSDQRVILDPKSLIKLKELPMQLSVDILSLAGRLAKELFFTSLAGQLAKDKFFAANANEQPIDEKLRWLLPAPVEAMLQQSLADLDVAGIIANASEQAKTKEVVFQQFWGETARQCYLNAFAYSERSDPFPAINAATVGWLLFLMKDKKDERLRKETLSLVEEICNICLDKEKNSDEAYWNAATLGEAYLILGDVERSTTWYSKAKQRAKDRTGDISTMFHQICLLEQKLHIPDHVKKLFIPRKVAVFVGHMIDVPHRPTTRFPQACAQEAKEKIGDMIDRENIGIGYCSLACGGDILFAEQMIEKKLELHLVLPFPEEEFIRTSVAMGGQEWVKRFLHIRNSATKITFAVDETYRDDPSLFVFNGLLLEGMALTEAKRLQTNAVMIALIHSDATSIPGGTIESLQRWQQYGRKADVIDIKSFTTPMTKQELLPQPSGGQKSGPKQKLPQKSYEIKTMLFADVAGFSRLVKEHHTQAFYVNFLGAIADVLKPAMLETDPPVFRNSWGDGLFLVFDQVEEACECALRLRNMVNEKDWQAVGLPPGVNIRIALHTGPVTRGYDAIIRRNNFFGSQVNLAARVEPVTIPGSIFVTEQTAAMLAALEHHCYACDYVGEKKLPKNAGFCKLFRLRHRDEMRLLAS
ncbi:MAG: adenylate/guanylate cyclase domain-containing protein [Magnetococcales bacterium]|nr:adenylate/guanylate cyclase domain-containing protein [Magnetococcales bacterium]